VIVRPASSLAQDRESSPVKDQRSTTVLRRQLNLILYNSALFELSTYRLKRCMRVYYII